MSWATTRSQIEELMNYIGFARAPEVFDIEKQPASFIDRVFCVQVEEISLNTEAPDAADRFYPTQKIKISASYELFSGSQDDYDAAIDKNLRIIQTLNDPNNRPDDVRMWNWTGTKTKLFQGDDNWMIVENLFDLQVQVVFPPATDDNDGLATVDENRNTMTISEPRR